MLERKVCPQCLRTCYSFSREGAWFCPHCGIDLAKEPLVQVDRATASVLPLVPPQYEASSGN